MDFSKAVINGRIRTAELNGRAHLVANAVLLRPGIVSGSRGPLYYPPEVVAANSDRWNGLPVTLNHPQSTNGDHLSARSPAVINKVGIGVVFNASADRTALRAEVWIDRDRARRVDSRIVDALQAGRPIELSTGLVTATKPAPADATFNGQSFTATVTAMAPDHLALLLDERGACSVKDGCGVLVNSVSPAEVKEWLMSYAKRAADDFDPDDLLLPPTTMEPAKAGCGCKTKTTAKRVDDDEPLPLPMMNY